ncbi:cadherin-19 isoform X3 [Oxyura jamaicensis]|uniref:cadherin-19 isoform X3 n=1 Tax=Oxyura jamaicensis TaxID=8884 RepID=UPI0015A60E0D|nr:cadherin-19 isoform X3 [Oxyura jamaicensis]
MNCSTLLCLLLTVVQLWLFSPSTQNHSAQNTNQSYTTVRRVKRGWIWEPLFVTEEQTSRMPVYVGQLKSDLDKQDGNLQYILTGEGAGSIFIIDEYNGKIYVIQKVDREEKPFYILRAQALNRNTRLPVEPESEFIIKVRDINDHKPQFLDGPYVATVPEMSPEGLYYLNISEDAPVGTTVGKIMAEDSDIGENAAMNYFIEGDSSDVFGIITDNETQEGIILLKKRVDYESKRRHSVSIKAVNRYIDDRFLKEGPFEDTTTVKISVQDADEPPVFNLENYVMEIAEGVANGSLVGVVSARDPDNVESPVRYSIVQVMHLKRLFSINEHNGTIITTEPLDREIASWHNITVTATETRNPEKISEANVYIQVLDVNDHAPEFAKFYETFVCENAVSNQLIQSISAVDKDDSEESHHFYFALAQEGKNNSRFTVKDNQDNTAGIFTAKSGFSRQEQFYFYLPILILDNGSPPLTSTNTLTVTVCDCDTEVNTFYCRYGAFMYSMGLSTEALVAVLACILILLVFFLAIVAIRQQRKKSLFSEKVEEFRENIVRYDDEGGGEEDTEAFDISALRTRTVMRTCKPRKNITTEIHSLYRQSLQVGPDSAIFRQFISEKLEEANTDPSAPPYDSLQRYVFEGTGSLAGSLSSLGSDMSDVDQNYDYLSDWGPHFKQLAGMYVSHRSARD